MSLALALVLAGCSAPAADVPAAPAGRVGVLEGWVLDVALRPVPGASVQIDGVGASVADHQGFYRLEAEWGATKLIVVTDADGFQPSAQVIQPASQAHRIQLNFTLSRLPVGAWTDTQVFNGFIACGLIVQVGHSHGGGSPGDDNQVSCPILTGEGKQFIPYFPEREADDMLIEVFWEAGSRFAEFITVILYDDQGEVVQWDEGDSPVRLDISRAFVKERFQDGRGGTIELRPGIADDDPPGEVYYALHFEQPFDVYATTSHGMALTTMWSITG